MVLQVLELSAAFQEKNTKAVIFPTGIPHHLDTLICQIACEISSVRQIFFYPTVLGNRLLPLEMTDGIESRRPVVSSGSSFQMPRGQEGVLQLLHSSNQDLKSLSLVTLEKSFWRVITERMKNFYLRRKQLFFTGSLPKKPMDLRRPSLIRTLVLMRSAYFGLRHLDFLISADKNEIAELLAGEANFIDGHPGVLTLLAHAQPEATTFPEGGPFPNHIDLVARIRAHGYVKPIFYREHPAIRRLEDAGVSMASGTARNVSYYEQLRKLGCYFIDDNTYKLSHEKLLVLTITGTVAIERSLRGLQTVVAGFPWYLGLPGTINLETFLDNSHNVLEHNVTTSENALQFLDQLFSKNSFENILGVGGLKSENLGQDISTLQSEFIEFVNYILLEIKN